MDDTAAKTILKDKKIFLKRVCVGRRGERERERGKKRKKKREKEKDTQKEELS